VLVPNEKGFERALAARERGLDLKVSVFTAASETFNQKNTNATIAQSIERFRAFVPRALEMGLAVRAYISCAVACPFEGRIEPSKVRAVADQLLSLAPNDASRAAIEIDLGDTIGVATPQDIDALLRAFEPAQRAALTLHLHDTFGRATYCVRNALNMGVMSFDGSAGGLGGCPYAGTPQRRAPGNIDTLALVRAVHAAGFATGVDLDLLAEAGAFASSLRAPAGGAA
jgi:hydroxymethylglutaryl-CoA lyase